MQRQDFHFELPAELIAQRPAAARSGSRMLALDGASGLCRDLRFGDLPGLLRPSDLLVFNDTRVVPARVFGHEGKRRKGRNAARARDRRALPRWFTPDRVNP